jgi:hypothetical protein
VILTARTISRDHRLYREGEALKVTTYLYQATDPAADFMINMALNVTNGPLALSSRVTSGFARPLDRWRGPSSMNSCTLVGQGQ